MRTSVGKRCQVLTADKVEFLPDVSRRHYQNYLALCPNHSAMFQHANGSSESMMEMFAALAGNELQIVLARRDASISFTKTHIADLMTVIESECDQRDESADDLGQATVAAAV